MTTLLAIFRTIAELFVDDELLAVGILVVVGLAAALTFALPAYPLVAGCVLAGGNMAVLAGGAWRTRKRGGTRSG